MKIINNKILLSILLIAFVGCKEVPTSENSDNNNSDSSIVKLEDNGYLSPNVIESIKEEQMRVKAISAYEYALPIVGLEQWHEGFLQQAVYGDWLIYENRLTKVPIITANTTTPYVVSFADLSKSSYYIEIPAGPMED